MISDLQLKDFVSRPALEALQLKRMQFIVKHAYEHSPFYTQAMDKLGEFYGKNL